MVFATLKNVPGFIPFNRPRLPQDVRVPCFAQANALGKRSSRDRRRTPPLRRPALRQAVYALYVAATFNSQTRHTWVRPQTCHFFIERHQRKNIADSLSNWQVRILKRVLILGWSPGKARTYYGDDATEEKNQQDHQIASSSPGCGPLGSSDTRSHFLKTPRTATQSQVATML